MTDRFAGAYAPKHNHKEAFKLMQYESEDGSVRELIWNSRDGVTPFIVFSEDGVEMRHVRWQEDRYARGHTPKPGDRYFADMTQEELREILQSRIDKWWDAGEYPMSQSFDSKEQALEDLFRGEWQAGMPTLRVTPLPEEGTFERWFWDAHGKLPTARDPSRLLWESNQQEVLRLHEERDQLRAENERLREELPWKAMYNLQLGVLRVLEQDRDQLRAEVERIRSYAEVRPEVARFASAMERKLKANDYKGGWDYCSIGHLFKRLREELKEAENASRNVTAAARDPDYWEKNKVTLVDEAVRELADVANFAMMLSCRLSARALEEK